jgi:uncharacterized protein YbjT (DUF2867 family)
MEKKINIIVFGATGKIGTALLQFFSQAEIPIVAVTRNKSKAPVIPFVEWKEADMNDRSSLYSIITAGSSIFLTSSVNDTFIQTQQNVIQIAREQGAAHIVKLSSGAADKNSSFLIARSHGEAEELLKDAGTPWTILRPEGFMQNWLGELARTVREERRIYEATGDGKRAYIDLRDIAEVAFTILSHPEDHAGNIYSLTGGEAVNYSQVAAAISQAINEETVIYIPLTMEEARQRMEQKGMPAWAIDTFLAYAAVQRSGRAAPPSDHVQVILKKPARSLGTFVQDHLESFK